MSPEGHGPPLCSKVTMSVTGDEVLTVEDGCREKRMQQTGRKKKTWEIMWP